MKILSLLLLRCDVGKKQDGYGENSNFNYFYSPFYNKFFVMKILSLLIQEIFLLTILLACMPACVCLLLLASPKKHPAQQDSTYTPARPAVKTNIGRRDDC